MHTCFGVGWCTTAVGKQYKSLVLAVVAAAGAAQAAAEKPRWIGWSRIHSVLIRSASFLLLRKTFYSSFIDEKYSLNSSSIVFLCLVLRVIARQKPNYGAVLNLNSTVRDPTLSPVPKLQLSRAVWQRHLGKHIQFMFLCSCQKMGFFGGIVSL